MALHTLGTKAATTLEALQWTPSMSPTDAANLGLLVLDDQYVQNAAPIFTASLHSNTTIDTFSAGALAKMQVGYFLIGSGILPGTIIVAIGASSVTINQAATQTASGVNIIAAPQPFQNAFTLEGKLYVPNRGNLKLLPNDYIGVGPSGEIILVPYEAVQYAGSGWTFT